MVNQYRAMGAMLTRDKNHKIPVKRKNYILKIHKNYILKIHKKILNGRLDCRVKIPCKITPTISCILLVHVHAGTIGAL